MCLVTFNTWGWADNIVPNFETHTGGIAIFYDDGPLNYVCIMIIPHLFLVLVECPETYELPNR